jgi:hypothetical protein
VNLSSLSLSLTARRHVDLDPARLFQTAGRVGVCYTSDTGGVSWDDLIAENMRALGPELVDSSGVWLTPAGNDNTTTGVGASFSVTQGTTTSRAARVITTNATAGRLYALRFRIAASTAQVSVFARDGSANGVGTVLSSNSTTAAGSFATVFFTALSNAFNLLFSTTVAASYTIDNISVREIDLSKCTLYHDSAATVPVVYPIAAGQGLGFLRDRSAGSVLGPELFPTYNFALWVSQGTGTATSANTFTVTGASGVPGGMLISGVVTVNRHYAVEVEFSKTTAASLSIRAFGGGADLVASTALTGVFKFAFTPTSSNEFYIRLGGAGDVTITKLSVRELPGYPLSQPTLSARGEFSRRYNLLSGTNMSVSGGVNPQLGWVGESSVVSGFYTPNIVGNAPSQTSTNGNRRLTEVSGIAAGTPLALRIKVTGAASAATVRLFAVQFQSDTVITFQEVVVQPGASAVLTVTASSPTVGIRYCFASSHPVFVDEPDLRLQADAHIGKPYQRVTTASDYDEEGFPTYLRRQTDDWARAFAVNPNGATKALAFWAGQKMSESAAAVAFETSPTSSGNLGVLALFTPANNGVGNIAHRSGGSQLGSVPAALSAAPARVAVRTQSDITNDVNQLRINGSLAASATADQGTGTYLTHDLFEGARAGTSLFANVRTYTPPMVMFIQPADPGPTASEIARLEAKYLRAAGVVS